MFKLVACISYQKKVEGLTLFASVKRKSIHRHGRVGGFKAAPYSHYAWQVCSLEACLIERFDVAWQVCRLEACQMEACGLYVAF